MFQRPRSCLASVVLLGFFAIFSAPLHSQTGSQTGTPDTNRRPVFKANARTVVVDVVVTGKNGRPVEGLHRDDFLAAEDGHPQQITSFEEHSGTQQVPASLPNLPPNVFTNIVRITPADAVTVLLLDGLNTELQNQSFVRAQMVKYLLSLQPGRRVAIFTLGTRLRFIQGFTDDPTLLAAALKNPKRGAGPQRSAVLQSRQEIAADQQTIANMASGGAVAGASALKQFQSEQTTSQTGLRADMTLEAFQELADYLAGIPGRKNVVWFSSAFPSVLFSNPDLSDSFAVTGEYGDKIRKTDALLAEAQVAIYPIAVEGVATGSLYDADQRAGVVVSGQMAAEISPPGGTEPPQESPQIEQENRAQRYDSIQRNANHTTMDDIARETGGAAFYNTNGLNDALAKVIDHGSYFYTLSYTPTNVVTDGRFRKIEVKLANSVGSYKLAYRRGYFAPDAKAVQAAATKPGGDPLHPFMGPGMPDSTQIPLAIRVQRSAIQPGADPAAQTQNQAQPSSHAGDNSELKGPLTRYSVDFVIAARGLQFDEAPNGSRRDPIEATLVVYDQNGKALNWMVRQINLDMDAARYAQVQENGVNFSLEIDVPKDGVSLRSGVYDHNSGLAGTLEIPLSSIVNSPAQTASSKPR